jgi:hypothetical protein
MCCILTGLAWGAGVLHGNAGESDVQSQSPGEAASQTVPFDLYWPLVDPTELKPKGATPLLTGQLTIRTRASAATNSTIIVSLVLSRPDDRRHREYWNTRLAYPDYDWMRHVRVWDRDELWLYPNLAFLFKLHGEDRSDRYGGWDPGKHVDNDFGAVLIRKYDAAGVNEHVDTKDKPLVSARWYPVGVGKADRRTIVHRTKSDDFTIRLAGGDKAGRGRIKVWFVYGDFFGHPAPKTWPKQQEFNGGTLAFFEIDWRHRSEGTSDMTVSQKVPPHTGFDWREWVGRKKRSETPVGKANLVDH